jgi:hypothetical protein
MRHRCYDETPFEMFSIAPRIAVAVIGSAVVGAGASMMGSRAQAKAAEAAAAQQMAMYKQTRADLAPYNQFGQQATDQLQRQLPGLTAPINMDVATLRNTPGYQFNLQQGLQATQNSAAARGLGISGAAMKGAAAYATGLADSTYQQQFSNANTNNTNTFNRLLGSAQLGESAAAQTGNYGTQTASAVGNNLVQAGTAQAAGYLGAANSLNNGVGNYAQYNAMTNGLYSNSALNSRFPAGGGIW